MTSCQVCHQIMAVASIYEDLAFTLYMQFFFFTGTDDRAKGGGRRGLAGSWRCQATQVEKGCS